MQLPPFLSGERYGDILLTGQRLPLVTILRSFRSGHEDAQILSEYDTLSPERLAQLREFYRENRVWCDQYFEEVMAEIERQAREHQPSPGFLRIMELMKNRVSKLGE